METRLFLHTKILALAARARRLVQVDYASVGIRPQDIPYAPSPAHFRAANRRLAKIDQETQRRLEQVKQTWKTAPPDRVLRDIALVEREVDRSRRAFGLFFEVFGQRGTTFAPALAAHDVIAVDCYAPIRQAAPALFRGPLLKPVCYMEHGFSPATMRRGIQLNRLLGEQNPFPIIRIPWDRDNPWQAVFLHEVAHNLQADLGIWQENRRAVLERTLRFTGDPTVTRTYATWHKEIFADLAAILLGGPSAAWGMAVFLAHPAPRTMTFRPGGAHPTAYLRILILAEMLRQIGFGAEGDRLQRVWQTLYNPNRAHRIPATLLQTADTVIPQIVDEIAFQTRRNLGQKALVNIIPFSRDDERAIQAGARQLVQGRVPTDLPPRFLVGASSYALATGQTSPRQLSQRVITHLTRLNTRSASTLAEAQAAVRTAISTVA
ncbi:hypothetical protein H6F76_07335 [Leptolyngbya sp. FACHB-321]|uniref:hypothetical protein n=1 Tax=Leptolyngbya sp. FACHB-321 TaxID=2692807 RepID=UPI0016829283|nr:hypothetical protein [Leptolyngbya sp. FACHB-321]MBD2034846.1 hypothetical protein [Leptolyngbya sp. FACHB-321]